MADKGLKDKAKGKVKKTAGSISGNKKMKAEGVLDEISGKAKEIASEVKDATEDAVDKVKEKVEKK
ncbi:MAG: CsbD family protein [Peptostreptococcus sp.]|uniref:CsbD family protein n=1 Tax=Peptostreptococcus sp. TaxID=1262 RepID=UPI002FC778BE